MILTVPHTPATEGFMDRARFQRMKRSAFFINIGRGLTTRLDDLRGRAAGGRARGRGARRLRGRSRCPPTHPLWTMPGVLITPHTAGYGPHLDERRFAIVHRQLPPLPRRRAAAQRRRQGQLVLTADPPHGERLARPRRSQCLVAPRRLHLPVPGPDRAPVRLAVVPGPRPVRGAPGRRGLDAASPMRWPAIRTSSAATRCSAIAFAIRRTWPRWRRPPRRSRAGGSSWASGRAGTRRSTAPTAGPSRPPACASHQLAEAIELIRRMWTRRPLPATRASTTRSRAPTASRARPQCRPSSWAGHGEKYLLRAVAQHADWWNYSFRDAPTYAHKQEVLKAPLPRGRARLRRHHPGGPRRHPHRRDRARGGAAQDRAPCPAHAGHSPGRHAGAGDGWPCRASSPRSAQRLTVNFADAPRPEGTWLFAASVLPNL